jgi:predicted nucleic acid-binding protein
MCIVIDTDTLSRVFNREDQEHADFKPVLKWILCGPGIIVYGGTRYMQQLSKAGTYMKIFAELERCGKVHVEDRQKVDDRERAIATAVPIPGFNDHHIVAILLVTGCLLVCSNNRRHRKYLRNSRFFPRKAKRPSVYGCASDGRLLCTRNIPAKFTSTATLGRKDRDRLTRLLGMDA